MLRAPVCRHRRRPQAFIENGVDGQTLLDFVHEPAALDELGVKAVHRMRILNSIKKLQPPPQQAAAGAVSGMCLKHPLEPLKLWCETCRQTICRDCTVLDHPRPGWGGAKIRWLDAARTRLRAAPCLPP